MNYEAFALDLIREGCDEGLIMAMMLSNEEKRCGIMREYVRRRMNPENVMYWLMMVNLGYGKREIEGE
jgi:hypothetical protein